MFEVEHVAPPGKFRVVGVDTFSNEDWVSGDFDTRELAIDHVTEKVKQNPQMFMAHVFNDKGENVYHAGNF